MPLDLKRLRQDPSSFVASVRHSLQLRRHWQHESTIKEDGNGNDDDDNNKDNGNCIIQNDDDDPRIKAVVRFHQESAATLQDLQQCRAKRNEQKKQRQQVVQAAKSIKANHNDNTANVAPCSSTNIASGQPAAAAAEVGISCPTKQDEESLEVSHRNASEALQRALLQLPNYVDEAIYTQYSCNDDYSIDDDDDDVAQMPVVDTAAAVHPKNQECDDDSKNKSTSTTKKVKILPEDAFYCIGGYEDLVGLPAAVMESINNGNNNNGKTNTCTMQSAVLTDLGMQLLKALEKILIETLSIKNHDDDEQSQQSSSATTTFASWTLPETMPLSIHNVDSIWPSCCCTRSGSSSSSSSKNEQRSTAISQQQQYNNSSSSSSKAMVMNAPSWMGLLRYHLTGKTYYDRELPMYNLLFLSSSPTSASSPKSSSFQDPAKKSISKSKSTNCNNTSTHTAAAAILDNNTLQDAREVQRRATWSTSHPLQNNGKKRVNTSHPWYKRIVAGTKRIEVCILTGPSLQADSRIVQESTMQRLCDFYKSLLLPSSATSLSSSCGIVRIRAVPPSQLLPAESSRLVLEGHWPMASSEKSSSKPIRRDDHPTPVCLAYLSNLQDYASCFHDAPSCTGSNTTTQQQQHQQNHLTLRHGNSRFGERVHVLTGTICSLTETLEWMMQHNAVMTTGSTGGIDLPTRVATAMQPCWSSSATTTPKGINTSAPPPLRLAYRRTVTTNKHGKRVVTNMPGNIENKPRSQQPIDLTTTVSTTSNDKESFIMENDTITSSTRRSFRTLQVGQKASPHQIKMEKLSCPFGFLPFYHC